MPTASGHDVPPSSALAGSSRAENGGCERQRATEALTVASGLNDVWRALRHTAAGGTDGTTWHTGPVAYLELPVEAMVVAASDVAEAYRIVLRA